MCELWSGSELLSRTRESGWTTCFFPLFRTKEKTFLYFGAATLGFWSQKALSQDSSVRDWAMFWTEVAHIWCSSVPPSNVVREPNNGLTREQAVAQTWWTNRVITVGRTEQICRSLKFVKFSKQHEFDVQYTFNKSGPAQYGSTSLLVPLGPLQLWYLIYERPEGERRTGVCSHFAELFYERVSSLETWGCPSIAPPPNPPSSPTGCQFWCNATLFFRPKITK